MALICSDRFTTGGICNVCKILYWVSLSRLHMNVGLTNSVASCQSSSIVFRSPEVWEFKKRIEPRYKSSQLTCVYKKNVFQFTELWQIWGGFLLWGDNAGLANTQNDVAWGDQTSVVIVTLRSHPETNQLLHGSVLYVTLSGEVSLSSPHSDKLGST